MPKNNNSASRLVNILKNAPHMSSQAPALENWAELLGVNETLPRKKAAKVTTKLNALQRELDFVREAMLHHNKLSEDIYEPSLARTEEALSIMLFSNQWNVVTQYLTSETITTLSICSELLNDEETLIEESDLEEIYLLVNELKALLQSSTLPLRLKALIRHQIELIEAALEEYPIKGATVLKEAVHSAVGEIIDAQELVKEHAGSPEVTKLTGLISKVNKVSDVAIKVNGVIQLGHKAWEYVSGLISNL